MQEVTVRPYEPGDEEGFHRVMSLTYNNGTPMEVNSGGIVGRDRYVATASGEVMGGFSVFPMTASIRGGVVKCGALAAVAVSPDARRLGVGAAMMRYYVQESPRQSTPVAALYGFRETWYRKFGYEVAGKRIGISCPSHRLPVTPDVLEVRRLGPADYPIIEPCYRQFALARNGLNLRQTEAQWMRVLSENKALTIYAFGDPVEAYAVISHNSAFWVDQSISEFVWTTRSGYESGLAFFRQLAINKTAITWNEPSDSPFYAKYLDNGISAQVCRPVMYRVTDVSATLSAIQTDESGEFRVRVQDDVSPGNEGPWRVEFGGGEVRVSPCEESDFSLDIRQLMQAVLGEPSLSDLARNGLVEVTNPTGLKAAFRLLPSMPAGTLDFF